MQSTKIKQRLTPNFFLLITTHPLIQFDSLAARSLSATSRRTVYAALPSRSIQRFSFQRFSFDSLAARSLTATSRRPVYVAHPSRSIQLSDFSCQIS